MDDATALLWGAQVGNVQAPPRRGPRPAFDLAGIAAAGTAIADAEGLAAATMQRVAESLGVTKMALYRYVPGKAELVALMVDLSLGPPPQRPGSSWRQTLDAWARDLFVCFYRHPWAVEATVGARPIGPNEVAWLEQAVAALVESGLTGAEMLDAAVTLIGHVRNLAQHGAATPGSVEQTLDTSLGALVAGREDRFPAVAAALASVAQSGGQDQALDFGLSRILDGIELLIASRRRPGRAVPSGS
jgi:AcrR family transcriptional regulator